MGLSPALEQAQVVRERLDLYDVRAQAQDDPKALVNRISYFDPQTKQWVVFKMFPPEGWETPLTKLHNGDLKFSGDGADDWYWQATLLDWLHDPKLHAYLIYKARQLGITLLSCAYALWMMLYRPGAVVLAVSYEETEAQKLVQATWMMFLNLHPILRNGVEVLTPRNMETLPSEFIRLRHKDGRISEMQAVPATGLHGHGARASLMLQDELAKQRYGRMIYEAGVPAVLSRGGKWVGISTADGVSNLETGEGNFFHHLYATRQEKGLRYTFLPWNAEPTRKGDWYETVAMKLPDIERARQYPLNENDGFVLSGAVYFDRDALAFYRGEIEHPRYSGQFTMKSRRKADLIRLPDGIIEVYDEPRKDRSYGIAVDTATGRAADYTSADVIDFMTGQIVAHLHAKIDSSRASVQVHFLGKWYNEAIICVERGGGYGEALIIALRDGNNLLPPYRRLYRHVSETKANRPETLEFGYPMSPKNRPNVIGRLERWMRERHFPWLSSGHVDELQTFVYKDTMPSPRAQDGCNDDRVMSLAMAVMLYERYGEALPEHPRKHRKRTTNKYRAAPVKAGGTR